jgi:hypothetical protein
VIVSASRRTDIPAFYSAWMMQRLYAGYALVRSTYSAHRVFHVPLTPDVVDCIVFWTKNPIPMEASFPQIGAMGFPFYVQYTLTPYGPELEQNLPPKQALVEAFLRLSDTLGAARVVWRYDPVVVDPAHPVSWHIEAFGRMCERIAGFTERCVFSFVDIYKRRGGIVKPVLKPDQQALAHGFAELAQARGIALYTCAEQGDFSAYGILPGACIDRALIERATGCPIGARADQNQRPACRCLESVDVGAYDSCQNGCVYCYATMPGAAVKNAALHDPLSPLLIGRPLQSDEIRKRSLQPQRMDQLSLFEDQ